MKVRAKSDITTNTSTIQNTELACKIGACLIEHDLTAKQLTEMIYENYNPDEIGIDFLAISVSKCISDLVNAQLVLKEEVDNEIHYSASGDFKKFLGDE